MSGLMKGMEKNHTQYVYHADNSTNTFTVARNFSKTDIPSSPHMILKQLSGKSYKSSS